MLTDLETFFGDTPLKLRFMRTFMINALYKVHECTYNHKRNFLDFQVSRTYLKIRTDIFRITSIPVDDYLITGGMNERKIRDTRYS